MCVYGRWLHLINGMGHIGAILCEAQTTEQRRRRCYSSPATPGL